ncbi:nucleotide exchange factor GrpE [Bremerella sp. T1]|uniref:nucleotide exchange factor GrpE n=1 Tax=Bremerella sp. TYQ1 TaxID=3119568 RepID=UPI001CCEC5D6|nr:nucleotide exchange factor GrpE [Bremerella volcania]UBM36179.1 nucleotide exchange factor GrpE [Bremerella volcania]
MSADHPEKDPSQDPTPEVNESPVTEEAASADAVFGDSDDQIEQLKQDLVDAEKRVLMAQADLENYRKRVKRERDDELKYANSPLLSDLLPVVDNLQRAMQSAGDSEQAAGIVEGIKLVEKQLLETMKKRGCEPIAAEGEPFDPNFHEAILQQPSADVEPGTVLHVAQVGYKLFDRCLRPSHVIVSKSPE